MNNCHRGFLKYTSWIFEIYTTLGILMVYAKYTQKIYASVYYIFCTVICISLQNAALRQTAFGDTSYDNPHIHVHPEHEYVLQAGVGQSDKC